MRKFTESRTSSPPKLPRRGMSLLFVVSLILFITLLGTSFVVVSQQFAQSAKARTRIDARGDSSRTLVERAFLDLVRGPETGNVDSVLRTHSILADMYGYGISARVGDNVAAVDSRIPGAFELVLDPNSLQDLRPAVPGGTSLKGLSDIPGAYSGLLLTLVGGEYAGTSLRIIGYSGAQNGSTTGVPYTFTAYQEQSRGQLPIVRSVGAGSYQVANIQGDRVVINGRAYHGYGAGGYLGSGAPNTPGTLSPQALQPNRSVQNSLVDSTNLNAFTASGVNENWDSPFDWQTMFLTSTPGNNGAPDNAAFDRPALYTAAVSGNPQVDQVRSFRAFGTPADGLQVDNDGDGVLDSVWIDPGYPIQTDIDGRRYKNLVAYMVLDLDGRFNVNAHGTLFQTDVDDTNGDGNLDTNDSSDGILNRATRDSGINYLGGVNPLQWNLPYGQYLGPPEISMAPALVTPGNLNDNLNYLQLIFTRYGEDLLPGDSVIRDAWNRYVQFGYPADPSIANASEVFPNLWAGGLFGTGLDLHGRYTFGIADSFVGNVPTRLPTRVEDSGLNANREMGQSPYEFSLMPNSRYAALADQVSDDLPYTAKELERVLRLYDRDSGMLPDRLSEYLNNANRHLFGHASFETPAISGLEPDLSLINPNTGLPLEADPNNPAVPLASPISINDRVYHLLLSNGFPLANAEAMVSSLLSYELRMGLPLDLNRPFGDGKDNNGNGIYDEFSELAAGNESLQTVNGNNQPMDPDGDGDPGTNGQLSRYQFAKQLYVLALLVTNDTATIVPNTDASGGGLTDDNTLRRVALAQWAVNVVDFRDADSINTPFEFDFNPFNDNGWESNGDLTNATGETIDTFVVWGLEAPQLLLTESVAFHDRRTEDLNTGGEVPDDPHFDNRLVPNASVFFELYRPWTENEAGRLHPYEFGGNPIDGIDLTQDAGVFTGSPGSPVWRMVVTTEANFSTPWKDVTANQPGLEAIDPAEQFRRIYFTRPNDLVEPVGARHKAYWPSATVEAELAGNSFVPPGGYAVVGSAGSATGGAFETWFGRRNDATWDTLLPQTRGITLLPASRQLEIRSGPNDAVMQIRNNVVSIPIDTTVFPVGGTTEVQRSLGISDPVEGYFQYAPPMTAPLDAFAVADGYQLNATQDIPLDHPDARNDGAEVFIMTNGQSPNFRSVFLQRLADPTLPFNAITNPYLTVDRQLVDLTSFNGVADDSDEPGIGSALDAFATNERGRASNPDRSPTPLFTQLRERRQLWPIEPATEELIPQLPNVADDHFFTYEMYESIGVINNAYNHADFNVAEAPVGFGGLTWRNRPYASHLELLDVPFTNSHQLLASPLTVGTPVGYTLDQLGASGDPYTAEVLGGQFGHLFNFFSPGVRPAEPASLANLLDFVRTPSLFPGTRIHLNESTSLSPPFNVLSRYREPGKVNVNTLAGTEVASGLLGPFFDVSGNALQVQGVLADGSPATYSLDRVGDVLASAQNDVFRNSTNSFVVAPGFQPVAPADATLLRRDANNNPLLPLLSVTTGVSGPRPFPWADPDRNSTHRFEALRRLGATSTTRSSVFAIWVTVGRFEVDDAGDLVAVAGAGVELGADTGKAKRSRGFYMIDRSIPVAFEPGANHNVEKMILVESIID